MAERHDSESAQDDEDAAAHEVPESAIDEAERLTRLAREATDKNEAAAYREARHELLAEHDYTARVREEEHDVLVVHPDEWVEDGTVHPDRIDDLDRGIERPLSGPGDPDNWEAVRAQNEEFAADITDEHGSTHGANVQLLAEFMSNHYAKPIEQATEAELEEFLTEYYVRNAWPTDDQKAVVEESIELVRRRLSCRQ